MYNIYGLDSLLLSGDCLNVASEPMNPMKVMMEDINGPYKIGDLH